MGFSLESIGRHSLTSLVKVAAWAVLVILLVLNLVYLKGSKTPAPVVGQVHDNNQLYDFGDRHIANEADAADAREAWRAALLREIKVGDTLTKIESFMAGAYRDRATLYLGGSGSGVLYFLIDDFNQVIFYVSFKGELTDKPLVERAGRWVKWPKGQLVCY